ncbi:hypothetical protein N665_0728s0015 [Sinapis alba]|nr:hypothetical protein N665_0728s0015 [Sinapis alba]
MKFTGAIYIALVIVLVSSLYLTDAVVEEEIKVVCDPTKFNPCLPALRTGSQPSTECCGKLKEQQSCLCGYIKHAAPGPFIKKFQVVLSACGIHLTC